MIAYHKATPLELFEHLLSMSDKTECLTRILSCQYADFEHYDNVLALIKAHKDNEEYTLVNKIFAFGAIKHLKDETLTQLLGTCVNQYKLVRCLGNGGTGVVYLGERNDGKLFHQVAFKFIYPSIIELLGDEHLSREAQYLADLTHYNIATLYNLDVSEQGLPYMVMEYIDGQHITEFRDVNKLNLTDTLLLFDKVVNAVNYAHAKAVIHADIKPSNILITQDAEPKLLDFGIAKAKPLHSSTEQNESYNSENTLYMASTQYASPEQLQGAQLTVKSDIYALGCVLRELLERVEVGNTSQIAWARKLVEKCISKHPSDRINDCQVLSESLRNIVSYKVPSAIDRRIKDVHYAFALRHKKSLVYSIMTLSIILCFFYYVLIDELKGFEGTLDRKRLVNESRNTHKQSQGMFEIMSGSHNSQLHHAVAASPFSLHVYDNHTAQTGELVKINVVNQGVSDHYHYKIDGPGEINSEGDYINRFFSMGVKTIIITAYKGNDAKRLVIKFVVNDGSVMPFKFSDIDVTDKDYATLHYLALNGLLIGRPGSTEDERVFSPDNLVNKAEALKLIMLSLYRRGFFQFDPQPPNYTSLLRMTGNKVEDFRWATVFVAKADELGFIDRPSEFDPRDKVTREWLAKLLYTTLNFEKRGFKGIENAFKLQDKALFSNIEGYQAARLAIIYQFLPKDGQLFHPQRWMTRREVALVSARILQIPTLKASMQHAALSGSTINHVNLELTNAYKRVGDVIFNNTYYSNE